MLLVVNDNFDKYFKLFNTDLRYLMFAFRFCPTCLIYITTALGTSFVSVAVVDIVVTVVATCIDDTSVTGIYCRVSIIDTVIAAVSCCVELNACLYTLINYV